MRVLIAGCGYVGTALGLRLVAAGHDVVAARRDPSRLPGSFTRVAGDLSVPSSLEALPGRIGAVALTASPDGRDVTAYHQAYVALPRTLLGFLRSRGDSVRRVVSTSSTAVYGHDDGRVVDEATPLAPARETAEVVVAGEETVRLGPFPATVVRLSGIYGPGRTRLLERVRRGEAICPPGVSYTNRIHRDDCAGVLAHVLGLHDPADTYVGSDREPVDRCELYRWLADQLDVAPPRRDGGTRSDDVRGKRCDSGRLVRSGYRFRYPTYREGYAPLLT